MSVLHKILGDPNRREVQRHLKVVEQVNALEPTMQALADADFAVKTAEYRERVTNGEPLEEILPEAFALVREASRRTIGLRHFDVQLVGGIVLHQGKIAEMKTGEGKTLVAMLPLYLNALEGKGTHLVTVNDYLARRDAGWNSPAYHLLGLKVAVIGHDMSLLYDPALLDESHTDPRLQHLRPITRAEAYAADITYGTNNEFGFDYLRDNMAVELQQCSQRTLHYAIVDEVDSILIDEARTPLIISGQGQESTEKYLQFARLIPRLAPETDYTIDEKTRTAALTEEGIAKVEQWTGITNVYEMEHLEEAHQINQALKAHAIFRRDKDYVVKDNEVVIVDEFTGRLMTGRRYSDGLHQAIEAKEGVKVQQEMQTLATITFQNYFRLYRRLAGMTGTAVTEAEEFHKIYHLEVVVIPTHKPMIREDFPDSIYKTEEAKFNAAIEEILELHGEARPVLVGTVSIEKSERLSRALQKRGIEHEVLNAKYHEREAAIIAQAGQPGAVTIATNMAGRGTDIVLGAGVAHAGGLHIIGTERHESRRIDNQLRGRSGRQGDPGSSRFFIALDDDLMRVFGSDRIRGVMNFLGLADDEKIEHPRINRALEGAQSKVEGHNFDARRHIVEYDDVMNTQRAIIYGERRKILEGDNMRATIEEWIAKVIGSAVPIYCEARHPDDWQLTELVEHLQTMIPVALPANGDAKALGATREQITEALTEQALAAYDAREAEFGTEIIRKVEQIVMLRTIDSKWVNYLTTMEQLKEGIGMRAFGQKDPLIEYKNEAYQMFQELTESIQVDTVTNLFRVQIEKGPPPPPTRQVVTNRPPEGGRPPGAAPAAVAPGAVGLLGGKKVGRNDPCPCGSGAKYKKCHGR
jgi:preprotein translocase subunit SecA